MNKTILFFAFSLIFLSGCKKNTLLIEPKEFLILQCNGDNDESTATRMVYTDPGYSSTNYNTGGAISVAWENGERIEFYIKGTDNNGAVKKYKTTSNVTSATGKTCSFTLAIPVDAGSAGFDINKPYTIYALSGGYWNKPTYGVDGKQKDPAGFIDPRNPRYVNFFNNNTGQKIDLTLGTGLRDEIMQIASAIGPANTTTKINLVFKHIGSLMAVVVKGSNNTSFSYNNLRLVSNSTTKWIYDLKSISTTDSAKWDLENNKVVNVDFSSSASDANVLATVRTTNILEYNINSPYTIPAGNVLTSYKYFIPVVPATLPTGLQLSFTTGTSSPYTTTTISTPTTGSGSISNPTSLKTGIRYYINRTYDGTAVLKP